jgi:hypothetical protein
VLSALSARAHQRILPKPQLEKVIGLAREVGALGVNVAHSGTVIGLLLDPGHADGPAMAAYLTTHLPGLESISLSRMVGVGRAWRRYKEAVDGDDSTLPLIWRSRRLPGKHKPLSTHE